MPINLHHTQNLHLTPDQKAWVQEKVNRLTHLADRLSDESAEIRVDLFHHPSHAAEVSYECRLTLILPRKTLRAESEAASLEASVNEAIDKAASQIEKYKHDLHRMGERSA